MLSGKNCNEITDKNINLAIQEFMAQQKSIQKGNDIKISSIELQKYIMDKFKCSSSLDLKKLIQPIIDQRNKYATSLAKSTTPQLFSFVDTVLPTSSISRTPSTSISKPSTLPIMPKKFYPGTIHPKSNDMSPFYYKSTNDSEELKHRNPKHGIISCNKDLSCPSYSSCDLDTNKCLSTDVLPILSWINWNNKSITGSGKTLVEYLLAQGVPMEDLLNERVPLTYNMQDYLEFIKSIETVPSNKHILDKQVILASELPVTFSNIIQLGYFTLSTKDWPLGLTMIPDFMKPEDQIKVFNYISKLNWGQVGVTNVTKKIDYNTQQYGYISNEHISGSKDISLSLVNSPPPLIKCLADLLYSHKFISNYPNQIIIKRYTPGQGIPAHIDQSSLYDEIVSISLGSPVIMNLTRDRKEINIPILPGSLLIMSNETRRNWSREIAARKSDVYKIPGLPDQSWNREERISITFLSIHQPTNKTS